MKIKQFLFKRRPIPERWRNLTNFLICLIGGVVLVFVAILGSISLYPIAEKAGHLNLLILGIIFGFSGGLSYFLLFLVIETSIKWAWSKYHKKPIISQEEIACPK